MFGDHNGGEHVQSDDALNVFFAQPRQHTFHANSGIIDQPVDPAMLIAQRPDEVCNLVNSFKIKRDKDNVTGRLRPRIVP